MANEIIKQNYKDIADAIRSKTGKNGLMTAEEMPTEIEGIETGITPTGNKDITTTAQVDVTEFATAQVNDADLVAANIKKNVNILGVTGTYEGYPEPKGVLWIYKNDEYINVKDKAYVNVQVNATQLSGAKYVPSDVREHWMEISDGVIGRSDRPIENISQDNRFHDRVCECELLNIGEEYQSISLYYSDQAVITVSCYDSEGQNKSISVNYDNIHEGYFYSESQRKYVPRFYTILNVAIATSEILNWNFKYDEHSKWIYASGEYHDCTKREIMEAIYNQISYDLSNFHQASISDGILVFDLMGNLIGKLPVTSDNINTRDVDNSSTSSSSSNNSGYYY